MTDSDIELRRLFADQPVELPADDAFVARILAEVGQRRASAARRRRLLFGAFACGALLLAVLTGGPLLRFGADVTYLLSGLGQGVGHGLARGVDALLVSPSGAALLAVLAGAGWMGWRAVDWP